MKKFIAWFGGLFDSASSVSSKRFVLILLALWGTGMGTFYVIMVQFGGKESMTTVGLIEFALGYAVTIAIGGTAAEAYKNKLTQNKEKDGDPTKSES